MACGSECTQEVVQAVIAAVTSAAQNNQARTADPVNVVTGAFLHSERDVAIPSQRLLIVLARHYNSQLHDPANDTGLQPFGPGWTYSFGMRLDQGRDRTVTYTDDQGAKVTFIYDQDAKCFVAPPGSLGLRLSRCAGDGFELRQVSGLTGEFDTTGRIVALRQPGPHRDSRVDFRYDDAGRLLSVTGICDRGIVFRYEFDSYLIREARDHSGRSWHYTYNDNNELSEVVDPAGRVSRYEYHGEDWQVAVDRKTCARDSFRAMRRVSSITSPKDPTPVPIVTNWYTSERRVYLQSDALGRMTRFEYNPYTRITGVTNPSGQTTIYCFDESGSTTKVRRPSGATTEYVFDDRRNLLTEIDPHGNRTEYVDFRDPEQLNVQVGLGRRAIGNRSSYLKFAATDLACGYDRDGNRPLVRNALRLTTRFEDYTVFGKPRRIVQPDGAIIQMEYDERSGLMVRRIEPLVAGRTALLRHVDEWTYDDFGKCLDHRTWSESVDGNAVTPIRTEVFEYDPQTQELLSSKRWLAEAGAQHESFISETRYSWDAFGRVTEEVSCRKSTPTSDAESRSRRFGYDVLDRRVWEMGADGCAACVEYDRDGRIVKTFSVIGADVKALADAKTAEHRNVSRWEYDAGGRETKFIDPLGGITLREWDDRDRCVAVTDPLGQRTTYAYDRDGNLTEIRTSAGHDVRIAYDAAGREVSRTDSVSGASHIERDVIGRPIREYLGDGSGVGLAYSYDDLRRSKETAFPDGTYERLFHDELGKVVRRERGRTGQAAQLIEGYAIAAR